MWKNANSWETAPILWALDNVCVVTCQFSINTSTIQVWLPYLDSRWFELWPFTQSFFFSHWKAGPCGLMVYFDDVSATLRRALFGLRHRRPRQQNSPLPLDVPPNPAPTPSPLPAEPPPLSTPTPSVFPSQNLDPQLLSSISPPITTSSFPNTNVDVTTFTTMYPITTTLQNTVTLTIITESVVFSTLPPSTTSAPSPQISSTTNLLSASPSGSSSPNNEISIKDVVKPSGVCLGHGIDAVSEGVLATVIVSSVLGLSLWVSYPDFVLCATNTDNMNSSLLRLYDQSFVKYMVSESGSFHPSKYVVAMSMGVASHISQSSTQASCFEFIFFFESPSTSRSTHSRWYQWCRSFSWQRCTTIPFRWTTQSTNALGNLPGCSRMVSSRPRRRTSNLSG